MIRVNFIIILSNDIIHPLIPQVVQCIIYQVSHFDIKRMSNGFIFYFILFLD
jgi:hypothetical protein